MQVLYVCLVVKLLRPGTPTSPVAGSFCSPSKHHSTNEKTHLEMQMTTLQVCNLYNAYITPTFFFFLRFEVNHQHHLWVVSTV